MYAKKANQGIGGVGYEKIIITGEIFKGVASPKKFVPVICEGNAETSLPSYLKSKIYIDFRDHRYFSDNLEELIRHLYQSPKFTPPPIGQIPEFIKRKDSTSIPKLGTMQVERENEALLLSILDKVEELKNIPMDEKTATEQITDVIKLKLPFLIGEIDISKLISTFLQNRKKRKKSSLKGKKKRIKRVAKSRKSLEENIPDKPIYRAKKSFSMLDTAENDTQKYMLEKLEQIETKIRLSDNHIPQGTGGKMAFLYKIKGKQENIKKLAADCRQVDGVIFCDRLDIASNSADLFIESLENYPPFPWINKMVKKHNCQIDESEILSYV